MTKSKAGKSLWDDVIFADDDEPKSKLLPEETKSQSEEAIFSEKEEGSSTPQQSQIEVIKEVFQDMTTNGIWTKDESAKQFEDLLQICSTNEVYKASKTSIFWQKNQCTRVDCKFLHGY